MASHKILNIARPDLNLQQKLSKELNISDITAQILINRGITGSALARKFLDPSAADFSDPFAFKDMLDAVDRVRKAIQNQEKVMVFGDYDVDGVTSVALLKSVLKGLGLEASHYMPHRVKEGYGLSREILKIARENNISLLITVDCGISNAYEVAQLKKHGVDTIITDHHEPSVDKLPSAAEAVINPKVKGCGYPFRELAGVGVAFKLCQALTGDKLSGYLDLVALGTIADVVPLTGENRVIVKEGLKVLSQAKRPGIRALMERAGILNKKFTTTFASFILGPRLNASGRMDSPEASLHLLLSQDKGEAETLAQLLEQYNRERQRVESKIIEEAEAVINKEVNFKDHKVIVVAKEDWHQGVLGVVASKLADRFYRPAIVISLSEGVCKGSGRSIKNFHLFSALGECSKFLESFGGHAHAAGLTITRESIKDFRESINRLAHDKLSIEDLLPGIDIDMEAGFAGLNLKSVAELQRLEPFGASNPEPLFITRGLKLKGEPRDLARETIK